MVGGSTLFGFGRGLVGFSPGPAIAALGTVPVFAFVAAILASCVKSLPSWSSENRERRGARTTVMSLRALVVEDEANLVELLRGYLEREGFEVYAASDGEAGLETARRVEPDVVVLDWMLPRRD